MKNSNDGYIELVIGVAFGLYFFYSGLSLFIGGCVRTLPTLFGSEDFVMAGVSATYPVRFVRLAKIRRNVQLASIELVKASATERRGAKTREVFMFENYSAFSGNEIEVWPEGNPWFAISISGRKGGMTANAQYSSLILFLMFGGALLFLFLGTRIAFWLKALLR